VNGYFGSRIAEMARRHGGQVDTIEREWGEVFSADEVREALRQRPARVVAIVHAETSTGALQPLADIVQVVHEHGALLIVDAVTSLAGVPLDVHDLELDVVYSGTQKCLGCPPGLAPVTVGPRGEEKLAARNTTVDTWYLNLSMVQRYWGPERTYRHTAPITLNFALYEALRMVAEEGLEARWERHKHNAALLWAGLFIPSMLRIHVRWLSTLGARAEQVYLWEVGDFSKVEDAVLRDAWTWRFDSLRIEPGAGLR
jgi:alanine-glyoxylate transaminase/serine-glyoxylate transaminase/serine-pyruvate transaminase